MAERAGRHPYQLRLALAALTYNHNTWSGVGERLNDLRGRDWEVQAESLVGASLNDLAAYTPGAVEVLQAMLVFRGGASNEALQAVAGEDKEDDVAFNDRLAAAVDSNLLEEGTRQARYDLHPLTRAYLETRRPPDPAHLLAYRRRHAAHFLGYAQKWRRDFDALEAELPNLRAGFEFVVAKDTRDDVAVAAYVEPMDKYFDGRSYWVEELHWLNEAVSAFQAVGDEENLAGTYNCIGLAYENQGEYEKALQW